MHNSGKKQSPKNDTLFCTHVKYTPKSQFESVERSYNNTLITFERNYTFAATSKRQSISMCCSSDLILLFEAVAVGCFHQVDVLQEVGHPDGGVQLSRLIGRLGPFTVVSRDIQKPAVFRCRSAVVLIYKHTKDCLLTLITKRWWLLERNKKFYFF